VNIKELVKNAFANLAGRFEANRNIVGLRTGFDSLDQQTLGFLPGEIVVIGSRPGLGKTTFATNIIRSVGLNSKQSCILFSTDHTPEEIVTRILCAEAKVHQVRFRTGKMSEQDWARMTRISGLLSEARIHIYHKTWLSLSDIRNECLSAFEDAEQRGVVIIDKFHSLVFGDMPADGAQNRAQEQFKILLELKQLAIELKAPIIILDDINKGLEARLDKRPMLSDLRDNSGVLEAYADWVLLLYRDLFEEIGDKATVGEVIVAKGRRSWFASHKFAVLGQYYSWENLSSEL